jgi:flagellar operon protein (TIGR03826 family)
MAFRNCPRCGKIFNQHVLPVCDRCVIEEEKAFDKLKEYLDEFPGSNVDQTAEATGVSTKKILQYLKEGRLEPVQGFGLALKCDSCGKKIAMGRYCETCQRDITTKVAEAFAEKKVSKGVGMHSKR